MSATCNMIQQAAHQREQLLRGLEETDSASARLMQQTRYIDDLEVQMSTTAKCAEKLRDKAMVGLREHEKYRDSTFRRLAHITSGKKEKFAEKAAKEEKEYLDALKLQKSAEDELAYTKQQRDEAEERRQEISAEAQRHENLQIELDALYDSIFAGPTPEFPEEDVKEDACDVARTHLQDVTRRLEHQQHILSLLCLTQVFEISHTTEAFVATQAVLPGGVEFQARSGELCRDLAE